MGRPMDPSPMNPIGVMIALALNNASSAPER
jgi:hypothetical protein